MASLSYDKKGIGAGRGLTLFALLSCSFSLLRFFYSPGFLLLFKGAHECFAFGRAKEMKNRKS
jgi:hypothetical protein